MCVWEGHTYKVICRLSACSKHYHLWHNWNQMHNCYHTWNNCYLGSIAWTLPDSWICGECSLTALHGHPKGQPLCWCTGEGETKHLATASNCSAAPWKGMGKGFLKMAWLQTFFYHPWHDAYETLLAMCKWRLMSGWRASKESVDCGLLLNVQTMSTYLWH